jgi:hypothetical protein
LTSVHLAPFAIATTTLGDRCLFSCTALTTADLSMFMDVEGIGWEVLAGCTALDVSGLVNVTSVDVVIASTPRRL